MLVSHCRRQTLPLLGCILFVLVAASNAFCLEDTDVVATFTGGQVTVANVKTFWQEQGASHLAVRAATGTQRVRLTAEELAMQDILFQYAQQESLENEQDVQEWTRNLFNRLVVDELLEQEVRSKIDTDDQAVNDYYEAQSDLSLIPETFSIRHIFFNTPDVTGELVHKRHQEALDVRTLITEGEDFQEMAQKHSETDGEKGGVVTVQVGQINPLLEKAALNMEIGEISEVVQTKHGFQILKLVGHEPASRKPLESVRSSLVSRMRQEQEDKLKEQLREKILERRKSLDVRFDLKDLDTLPRTSEKVVCEVPGILTVTAKEVKDTISRMTPSTAPVYDTTAALEVLESGFIFQHLAIQHAQELGLDQSPDIQQRAESEKRRLLIGKARRALVAQYAAETPIQPEDVQTYYNIHPNEFLSEATYLYEALRIPTSPPKTSEPTASDQHLALQMARQRADDILARVHDGLTFQQAAEESEDLVYTPANEPVTVRMDQATGALDQTLLSLSEGEVCSTPLLQMNSFLLVRVVKIEDAKIRSLDVVRAAIESRLEQETRSRTDWGLRQRLLEEKDFVLDEIIAAQVDLQS